MVSENLVINSRGGFALRRLPASVVWIGFGSERRQGSDLEI
jgi:hypothetical protein